jgi:hypothetical protein
MMRSKVQPKTFRNLVDPQWNPDEEFPTEAQGLATVSKDGLALQPLLPRMRENHSPAPALQMSQHTPFAFTFATPSSTSDGAYTDGSSSVHTPRAPQMSTYTWSYKKTGYHGSGWNDLVCI